MVTSNKDAAKIWKMIEDVKSSDNTPDRGPNDLEETFIGPADENLTDFGLNDEVSELIVEKIRRYNGEFKTYTILTKNNNFFVDGILVHSEINH